MTPRPRVVLVAALARDRTIGRAGAIPWRYSEDLRHFRRVTEGTALVMGRRTFDSIGRPLPGRVSVVISREPARIAAAHPGVLACASLEEALALAEARGAATVSVIGGGEVYAQALPLADEMVLTFVPEEGGGDVYFPAWNPSEWRETSRERIGAVEIVRYMRTRR